MIWLTLHQFHKIKKYIRWFDLKTLIIPDTSMHNDAHLCTFMHFDAHLCTSMHIHAHRCFSQEIRPFFQPGRHISMLHSSPALNLLPVTLVGHQSSVPSSWKLVEHIVW